MLKGELKKYIGKLTFLFVVFGIGYFFMLILSHTSIENQVRQYYEEYINLLEGPLNSEKEAYIADEDGRVNGVIEKAMENVQAGEQIDFDKMDYALEHEKAWQLVYDRYMSMDELANADDRVFYNDLDLMDFFKSSSINYFEIFLLVIIALYAVTSDFHNGRHIIIKTTYRGNVEYILTKQNALICVAVAVSVLFSLIEFICIAVGGELRMLSFPIKSMSDFAGLKWSMSIGEYILIRGINHIVWCVVSVLVMCMIGLLIKRLQTGLFIGLVTVIIPIALKGIFDKRLLVWIYSIHLDKDFSLCNYGLVPVGIAAIFAILIYVIDVYLWKASKCNTNVE